MSRCMLFLVMSRVIPRSGLGRVSVLSLSFLGDVSVLLWCCLGLVLVLSCLRDVSVLFWWCLCDVVLSLCWLGDVSVLFWWCFCDVSVMSRSSRSWSRSCPCLFFLVMSSCLFWCCFVGFWVVFWGSFSDALVVGERLGHVSVKSPWCVVMVLWCLWWWVGDGLVFLSLMLQRCFFCFGDCVLIFWWWTLMNILTGFLSKTSNSNLNLYIVHLWANQCSCSPYVDRWCFLVSVMSRSCLGSFLGLVSVLSRCCFGDVSVMSRSCLGLCFFLVMSRGCFGFVCFGFLMVFWGPFSDVLVASRAYSVKSPWCVVMVLWCFDDEWVIAWCCVVDVAVLFFLLWWWCFDFLVMNTDEHFDRVFKQNFKFEFEFVYCAPLGKPV